MDPKFFWINIFSDQNCFLTNKFLDSEYSPKLFWIKIFLQKFCLYPSFLFNLSYFLEQKFFWINFFFCNGSSSQTPGLPKLNTLDLSLVSLSLCAKFQTLSSIISSRFWCGSSCSSCSSSSSSCDRGKTKSTPT